MNVQIINNSILNNTSIVADAKNILRGKVWKSLEYKVSKLGKYNVLAVWHDAPS